MSPAWWDMPAEEQSPSAFPHPPTNTGPEIAAKENRRIRLVAPVHAAGLEELVLEPAVLDEKSREG